MLCWEAFGGQIGLLKDATMNQRVSGTVSSSYGTFSRFVFRDISSRESITVILTLMEVEGILVSEGLLTPSKQGSSFEQLQRWIKAQGTTPIDINFARLRSNFGNDYINKKIVVRSKTFNDLQVQNESQLLEVFFTMDLGGNKGRLKEPAFSKYKEDMSFIALLLDLGLTVVRGDYVNDLSIYKK
jgi:hypothetical protein